ncbi:hypothetical protein, partial [Bartonella sp. AD328YNZD]|uniref:hypothetical protein n=1 Tax=Bartonella sp. AD328YNZD TaxID=3243464 RepID=UPI0035D0AFE6
MAIPWGVFLRAMFLVVPYEGGGRMMVVRSVILKAGVFCGIIAVFLCFAYRGSGKDGRPLKMAREIIQNVYGL